MYTIDKQHKDIRYNKFGISEPIIMATCGWYIGQITKSGEPYNRLSDYYTQESARALLKQHQDILKKDWNNNGTTYSYFKGGIEQSI